MRSDYFLAKANEQSKWRMHDSINLLPSENVTSPEVRSLLSSDFGHRYTLPVNSLWCGEYLENSYRGTRITTEIERSAEKVACDVFGAKHACVQPLSGHIAAMIALLSVTKRGGSICSIPVSCGGYDGYAQPYLPDILGLTSWELPFSKRAYNLDAERSADLIRKRKPDAVVLGASFILFPYDIGPIRDACDDTGAFLIYDGSHVLGLIAGGEFQAPLKEGADILYGSTHKSFFGPQGGIILTERDDLDLAIRKNLTWRVVDNVHWNRVAALGHALLEMKRFGRRYARQVVKNSQRLGMELSERGLPLRYKELGFTRSHQLLIDTERLKKRFGLGMNDFSVRLERSNIIIDSVGRLGTAEITRLGAREKDMTDIAELFIEAAHGKDVRGAVRRKRRGMRIAFRLV
jgi:glycine hydroxymethyltransferase